MFVIMEEANGALVCYATGEIMQWANDLVADSYAIAISMRNPGGYSVVRRDSKEAARMTHGYRLSGDPKDPLKITGAYPFKR